MADLKTMKDNALVVGKIYRDIKKEVVVGIELDASYAI